MRKSKNYIKSILNVIFLQRELSDEDKLIDILLKRYKGDEVLSSEETNNMIQNLQSYQQEILEKRKKLANIDRINTLGEYLQLWQEEYEFNDVGFAKLVNMDSEEVGKIRKNVISPIYVEVKKISRLLKFLKLKFEEAKILIEKTHFIVNIDLSSKEILSRYDKKKEGNQGKSMRSATEELLMKAHKKKPLTEKGKEDLQEYLTELKTIWRN